MTLSAEAFERFSVECLKQKRLSMTAACVPCTKQATPKIGRVRQLKKKAKAGPAQCPELGVEVVGKGSNNMEDQ